ncbi:imelysin family protein [Phocoenobacter skyensis]|uniref:Imelysin family protein n=1 Tax=Phocoenobacter skyensis TaxID=97481 RepID=A0A1H8A6N0_9PAST|nr:imelysin family protein [Pasteurella skyensis]MDP8080392.1 imelysin family protein [Pasteurella skyensis]MDP8086382.1 imelysin family protein [Pasteurella skyensis]MDP8186139.1 imelysin family protein [Pasteurella skyensis]QLB22980.1 imelysin [Pasteurella skyensis]SEM66425.1 putative iron-regulated protein [Pasteurella skyensis]
MLKKTTLAVAIALASSFVAIPSIAQDNAVSKQVMVSESATSFLNGYAKMADLLYTKSYEDAERLQGAIKAFAKNPTEKTLDNVKKVWLKARDSYGVTESFRLSNGPIDAEEGWIADAYGNLEGQINAWPLDENMIDYTIDAEGKRTSGNIIDSKGNFTPANGGEKPSPVNVDSITVTTITDLNENGGEANVASGWHAIEFLLWGQDQDYGNMIADKVTNGAMVAGQRPLTDFTTDKFAKRRLDYLVAAADKLVADIALVKSAWAEKVKGQDGLYRAALLGKLTGKDAAKNIDQKEALKQIFGGMGMFVKSELANERIAVAVLTPSEEDEHSCFSDNTHKDIEDNYLSFKYLLTGNINGQQVGLNLLTKLDAKDRADIETLIAKIEKRIAKVNEIAETKMHFDYQVHPNNKEEAKNIVRLKNDLRKLGDKMILVAKAMGISLTSEDVTDAEETKL